MRVAHTVCVFHRLLVLALIQFGFAALVCKNSETDDSPKYRRRKQRKGEHIARLGNDRHRRRRCQGALTGAGEGAGVLPGVGWGVLLGVSSCGVSSGMRASFITTV